MPQIHYSGIHAGDLFEKCYLDFNADSTILSPSCMKRVLIQVLLCTYLEINWLKPIRSKDSVTWNALGKKLRGYLGARLTSSTNICSFKAATRHLAHTKWYRAVAVWKPLLLCYLKIIKPVVDNRTQHFCWCQPANIKAPWDANKRRLKRWSFFSNRHIGCHI